MPIKEIRLSSYTSFDVYLDEPSSLHLDLLIDGEPIAIHPYENQGDKISYQLDEQIEILGHEAVVSTQEFGDFPLLVTDAVDFFDFDNRFTYLGNDLGANYTPTYTTFKLWAPLASKVSLEIDGSLTPMRRISNGVYIVTIDGDLDGMSYRYEVSLNGKTIKVIDPYGKSSTANGEYSSVINLEKLEMDMYDENLSHMNSYLDAIIYEANVRDMTSDPSTDIVNKGKFLGLIEKGRKTPKGNPAGFDYLNSLGFTHLQLMPVLDFQTVDELNPNKSYNWGYDPMQFFALEGSYSTDPNDPYARMKEFKRLVRDFHRVNIRINLDVVYNHIYKVEQSILQKITPNYFFRRDEDNKFIDHSYCGNDFASERSMARKLIVDSIKFLMNVYHVDGFRFDLMGLLDVDTMKEIEKEARLIKNDVMLYGEGWDMGAKTSDLTPLANMNNAHLLKGYAFFNDRYRNIARGSGGKAKLDSLGYLLGNESYKDGFKFIYCGSSFDITFPKLFSSVSQSLNYVECHDNATLYDAIKYSSEVDDITRLIKKINKTLMLSFGIPFIHAGQEIAMSKSGHHNTYNEGDKYNAFSYSLLDERYEMAKSLSSYIALRKDIQILHENSLDVIYKNVDIIEEKDMLHIRIVDIKESHPIYHIFINSSLHPRHISLENEVDVYTPFGYRKAIASNPTKNLTISPQQASIYIEINKKD